MKKIMILMIIGTFLTTLTFAQNDNIVVVQDDDQQDEIQDLRDNLTFGIKGGLNVSNVYDSKDENFDTNAKLGWAAGVFLGIPLSTYVGIQPELLYSQRGFQGSGSLLGSDYEYKRTTNYLDVPIFLAIKPSPIVTLLAGPQFSFLMSSNNDFKNDIISGGLEQEFDNEDLRKNTLCLTGGIDLNLENLVLSGRAGWDLKENNEDGTSKTPRYKNVWLQATIGFRF